MSKRENVLNVLFNKLSSLSGIPVKRNDSLPQKIPSSGLVVLRDGKPGEPEVILSPPLLIYQHETEVEVIVQALRPEERDAQLDSIMEQIGTLLKADTTLSGAVDYCYSKAPEFLEEVIEGAPTMKAAIIPVVLEYASETALT